jgi:CheY-like chemotaxis protein
MAGGIAHDFNNFLTPILGEAMLLLDEIPNDDPARTRVNKIRAASQRAALLTSQMLAYAGKSTLAKSNIGLSQLVGEMAELMESGTGRGAIFKSALQADLPPIQADPAQITQVVMNLITNASEAAGDKRGEIRIETGLVSIDSLNRSQLVLGSDLKGSEYVYVEVHDNGEGMTPGTQARIFDPFFTTKFAGRGLGLAAVLGIVRNHHGAIEIDSGPQRGTRFRVLFPAAEGEIDVPVATTGLSKPWRGKGTILIVDDDDGVIDLMQETLQRTGLAILTATDGQEGIRTFSEHADEIDLVLLDRTMPTTSGEDACLAMREIRPDVQIVLVSGYSEERAAEHFEGPDLAGFLQKPFLPEELIDRVRSALER